MEISERLSIAQEKISKKNGNICVANTQFCFLSTKLKNIVV